MAPAARGRTLLPGSCERRAPQPAASPRRPPPPPVGGGCSAEAPGLTARCCRRSPARPLTSSRMQEALPPPLRGGEQRQAGARRGRARSGAHAASRLSRAGGGTRARQRCGPRLARAGRPRTPHRPPHPAPAPHSAPGTAPDPSPRTGPRRSPGTGHPARGAQWDRPCTCGTDAEAWGQGNPLPGQPRPLPAAAGSSRWRGAAAGGDPSAGNRDRPGGEAPLPMQQDRPAATVIQGHPGEEGDGQSTQQRGQGSSRGCRPRSAQPGCSSPAEQGMLPAEGSGLGRGHTAPRNTLAQPPLRPAAWQARD